MTFSRVWTQTWGALERKNPTKKNKKNHGVLFRVRKYETMYIGNGRLISHKNVCFYRSQFDMLRTYLSSCLCLQSALVCSLAVQACHFLDWNWISEPCWLIISMPDLYICWSSISSYGLTPLYIKQSHGLILASIWNMSKWCCN